MSMFFFNFFAMHCDDQFHIKRAQTDFFVFFSIVALSCGCLHMVYLWIKSSADIDATLFQYFSPMAGRPPAGVPLVPGLPR